MKKFRMKGMNIKTGSIFDIEMKRGLRKGLPFLDEMILVPKSAKNFDRLAIHNLSVSIKRINDDENFRNLSTRKLEDILFTLKNKKRKPFI